MSKSIEASDSEIYSLSYEGKILYMRHAESIYNVEMNKCHSMALRLDSSKLDVHLSEKGITQAKAAQEEVNKLNLEVAYVSPLYRALQTAYYALETYPNKNLVVKVHPFIAECVGKIDCYTWNIQQSKKEFNMESKVKFDWSLFDEIYKDPMSQDLFFVERIQRLDKDTRDNIIKKIYENYPNKDKLKKTFVELAKLCEDYDRERLENLGNTYKRGEKFKEFLKKTHLNGNKSEDDKDKKVLVITHNAFTRMSTSKKLKNMDEESIEKMEQFPDDCLDIKNCQMISVYI